MTVNFIRIFFLILSSICGYYLWPFLPISPDIPLFFGAIGGFLAGLILIFMESKLEGVSLRNLSTSAFGLIFGFFMAWMVTLIVKLVPMHEVYYSVFRVIFTLVFCYLGMVIAIKGKDEFNLVIPYVRFTREDRSEQLYLLDTSVIIDGRIAGICETGFLKGKLVVPRFVLQELQYIADSSDDSKRNRGRRGLDMLEKLRGVNGSEVVIHEERLADIKEVDSKLVRLAKILNTCIVTNDFNLNKVAKLENVDILNINDLANSLRPVVFPGENINVYIRKEGKEKNQGVAFMDDGTMIVVDNAKKMIGKNVNIAVTSVLQTSAGKMIFAALVEKNDSQKRHARPSRASG